jgi:hypothetical protein
MTPTTRRAELLEQIERERRIWEQLLAEAEEARMTEPGVMGDWSFKDVVAHLSGWRVLTLARLEAAQHGREPEPPPGPAHLDEDDEGDLDQINDWIYRASQDRPLQDVLAEYSRSFERMRAAVAGLSDQALSEPGHYPWLDGYPLEAVLHGTFGHFHDDHEPGLREWLRREA